MTPIPRGNAKARESLPTKRTVASPRSAVGNNSDCRCMLIALYSAIMANVTQVLDAAARGDAHAAAELLPLIYGELRQLAARHLAQEAPGQTLHTTALVHEASLRLVASPGTE